MTWKSEQYEGDAQVELLAQVAVSWGFQRPVSSLELTDGCWFAMYRGSELALIYWFERFNISPTDAGLHYVVSPHVRKAWPVRFWLNEVIPFARKSGVQRLLAHVDGLPLVYLYRYVDIWNRRHEDVLTIDFAQWHNGKQVVAIALGAEHGS